MKSNYKRLGDYIRQVDVRNRDLAVERLLGLSVNKQFIPSIANTIGTDMSNYKVVAPSQFVYIADTSRRGDKIAIALLGGQGKAIVSAIYTVFEITNEMELLPEYLMMWFRRPEFDRYARFKSHGSAREVFEWSEMCEVLLPIPPIEEQRKIVAQYQAIERRIENNRRLIATLEETAKTIYRKMFVDNIDIENLPKGWRIGTLGEFAVFKNGKAVQSINGEIPVYGGNGIVGGHNSHNAINVIVIGRVGANCGNIQIEREKCWINDNAMLAVSKEGALYYLYWLLNTLSLNSKSEGSSQPLLTQTILTQIDCVIPNSNTIQRFDKIAEVIEIENIQKRKEIGVLIELQSLLLAKLGQ
ncbi:restriction endonuclease subunit S [Parabacteroides distasonis]|uniref:restriction endonuclease subunit S n=1 Tax=Parabacteroides distasonis TaxID=823 RepID=UPI002803C165|nr:restriction endonuclease subunit S [Parabacteroides distasonis]WMI42714.1 restriction endonuclease subunit S [Parabacteroides distasonis]